MIARLWNKDTTLFATPDAPETVHAAIRNRLGWLDAPAAMTARLEEVGDVLAGARADGLTHVLLIGMGGSSLCADVMRQAGAGGSAATRLVMLDSTDEKSVLDTAASLDPARTLVVVASKSGGTIEVTALERYFRAWVERACGAAAGRQFVAITDPGTPLVAHADAAGYRHTFVNPPDIGGRYSALSLFGLVPAGWLGIDLAGFLREAQTMADRCRRSDGANPGLALGDFMAEQAGRGRDKMTLRPTAPIGLWIEQLVAESTGKAGRGVLPVVDEPEAAVAEYGADRAFVLLDQDADQAGAFTAAGHPVFTIDGGAGLGGEFFRWAFATAVTGARLEVNPFDEPNVADAKARTRVMLDHFLAHGGWPAVEGVEHRDGVDVRRIRRREPRAAAPGYVALLDYLPTDRHRATAIERIRRRLRARTSAATTYGVGPRYLHSTGQYHKGGTNDGRFILMTAPDATSTAVPGAGYTFSALKHAQALGDVAALEAAGREVLHLHVAGVTADQSGAIERLISE